ncbi:sensor kinase protein [Thioploca ingrica]|uniref:histidine kinase n=1 Tax=Thioploca ingrica TaxID=40754 RepID=A0A090AIY5_9GAMM|nr:sensor kinase protein [Thioploca ingrica]
MTVSIRKRLLFLLVGVIGSLWVIVTWRVYIETQHEVEELFDAQLAQSARVLFGLIKHEVEDQEDEAEEKEQHLVLDFDTFQPAHRYEQKLAFLVRSIDGKLLFRSATAPLFSMPSEDIPHYTNQALEGHLWRVFTLREGQFWVQTAERYDIRNELIHQVISSTLSILLISLPLVALLIWFSIGQSLKPLHQVASEISARRPEQLQQIDVNEIPLEIRELINALNALFSRLHHAFENERRFTADAAHELRTPLAAIKTQAQVAQRAKDSQQRQQALQKMIMGLDRATHLVEQLLNLARIEATQTLPISSCIDLHELVNHVIIDLTPQALDKAIDLGLETMLDVGITRGHWEALELMMRNLVDNAIHYTPPGGHVTITLTKDSPSFLTLCIIDTGPGIPLEQRKRIFERFYRGNNHNQSGSGLGLSIAQRVAQLHHLDIQLLNNPIKNNGLCVQIQFPLK